MSGKLISLVLAMALTGFAPAATFYWNSNVQQGDWNVASNWSISAASYVPAAAPPASGTQAYACPTSIGSYTDVTIKVTTTAVCSKLQMKQAATTWNIHTGASLTNDGIIGATEILNGASGVINVDGQFLNEFGSATTMLVKFGGSGSSNSPSYTININNGGLMTVHNNAHNAQLIFGTFATGTDLLNINSGGELDVDTWLFTTQPATSKLIKIYGTGKMVAHGDVTASADIGTKIIPGDSGGIIQATYDAGTNKTTITEIAECPDGDMNGDCGIDMLDFALIAKQWLKSGCGTPNSWCSGADFNFDGTVNFSDLKLITDNWLEGI